METKDVLLKTQHCGSCNEPIRSDNFANHVKSCKLYRRFLKETPSGIRCQLCGKTKKVPIHFMRRHVERSHGDSIYPTQEARQESRQESPQESNIMTVNLSDLKESDYQRFIKPVQVRLKRSKQAERFLKLKSEKIETGKPKVSSKKSYCN